MPTGVRGLQGLDRGEVEDEDWERCFLDETGADERKSGSVWLERVLCETRWLRDVDGRAWRDGSRRMS